MSNLEQINVNLDDQRKHLPENKNSSKKIFCVCLDCRHTCICANKKPSLTKYDENIGANTCRSYECFKNQHATCKLKTQQKPNESIF